MKTRVSFACPLMLLCIIAFLSFGLPSFSQEEIAMAPAQEDEFILELPKACVKPTLADTILPTICNSGQGLLQYDCLYVNTKKDCRPKEEKNATAVYMDIDESEIKILKEQQHFMEEQSIYEIKQQIRKDKMDLQLGEIIQGFYMKPPF